MPAQRIFPPFSAAARFHRNGGKRGRKPARSLPIPGSRNNTYVFFTVYRFPGKNPLMFFFFLRSRVLVVYA